MDTHAHPHADAPGPTSSDTAPLLGGLDAALRDDDRGAVLARLRRTIEEARRAVAADPGRRDADRQREEALTLAALQAADEVLSTLWAGFHPATRDGVDAAR